MIPEQHPRGCGAGTASTRCTFTSTTCLAWGFPGATPTGARLCCAWVRTRALPVSREVVGVPARPPAPRDPGLGLCPCFLAWQEAFLGAAAWSWHCQPGCSSELSPALGPFPPLQTTDSPRKETAQDLQIEKSLRGQNTPSGAHANPGDHPHTQSFTLFQIPRCEGPHLSPPQNPSPTGSGGARRSCTPRWGPAAPCCGGWGLGPLAPQTSGGEAHEHEFLCLNQTLLLTPCPVPAPSQPYPELACSRALFPAGFDPS